jgi:hypothetical protein
MNDLSKAVQFLDKSKFAQANSITNIIKHCDDPIDAHKTLITKYQDHLLSRVHEYLGALEEKDHVMVNGHKFSCPVKFMEHVTNEFKHEYIPHKQIEHIQNKVIEYNNQRHHGIEM